MIRILLLLLCSQAALADAVLLFETTNPRTPDRIEIKDSKIRLSNAQDPIVTLFDYQSKTLTFVDQKQETYFEISEKGLKKIIKTLKKIKADMQKGLNEKQRQQVERVFAKQGLSFNTEATQRSVKKIKSSSVKGIDCDVYTTLQNGQLQSTHCIATARYLGVNSADFRTYLYLMQFLKQTAIGLDAVDPAMQHGFTGMPLVSYDAQGNLISKFISLRSHNLDKNLFTVPDGYRQVAQP